MQKGQTGTPAFPTFKLLQISRRLFRALIQLDAKPGARSCGQLAWSAGDAVLGSPEAFAATPIYGSSSGNLLC
jgi:hypothetical protein